MQAMPVIIEKPNAINTIPTIIPVIRDTFLLMSMPIVHSSQIIKANKAKINNPIHIEFISPKNNSSILIMLNFIFLL